MPLPAPQDAQAPKRTLAARAGQWSARHRRIAVGGRLAFVILALIAGGAIEMKSLAGEDTASRGAAQAVEAAGFPERSDEQMLQARGAATITIDDAAFKRAVDVTSELQHVNGFIDVEGPFAPGDGSRRSKEGKSVTFTLPSPKDDARIVRPLDAT